MTINERLQKVKTNWQEFKSQDTRFVAPNSTVHKYLLNDVISQNELADFEKSHGIELPEEYKSYLLLVIS